MLRAILDGDEPYEKAAIMGSIEVFDGIEHGKPDNTTPEAPELWRHLANAQKCGLTYMAMEVSSQALKYDRTYGLHLDIAVFLNIGRDHISPVEHPTFEDYFASKMKIFDMAKTAVINRDTEHYEDVMAHVRAAHERNPECCQRVCTFSATNPKADIWADDISSEYGVVSFRAHTPMWTGHLSIPMPGLFNVDNALAAITVASLLGFSGEKLQYPLLNTHVSGRMELIPTKDRKVTALVDYAHNRLAYQKLFSSSSPMDDMLFWELSAARHRSGDAIFRKKDQSGPTTSFIRPKTPLLTIRRRFAPKWPQPRLKVHRMRLSLIVRKPFVRPYALPMPMHVQASCIFSPRETRISKVSAANAYLGKLTPPSLKLPYATTRQAGYKTLIVAHAFITILLSLALLSLTLLSSIPL